MKSWFGIAIVLKHMQETGIELFCQKKIRLSLRSIQGKNRLILRIETKVNRKRQENNISVQWWGVTNQLATSTISHQGNGWFMKLIDCTGTWLVWHDAPKLQGFLTRYGSLGVHKWDNVHSEANHPKAYPMFCIGLRHLDNSP